MGRTVRGGGEETQEGAQQVRADQVCPGVFLAGADPVPLCNPRPTCWPARTPGAACRCCLDRVSGALFCRWGGVGHDDWHGRSRGPWRHSAFCQRAGGFGCLCSNSIRGIEGNARGRHGCRGRQEGGWPAHAARRDSSDGSPEAGALSGGQRAEQAEDACKRCGPRAGSWRSRHPPKPEEQRWRKRGSGGREQVQKPRDGPLLEPDSRQR
mmetsp:Transcript_103482/g.333718  ORF Transcript_103482/g.333718 Transcript_103482/m.333718 type:complete len:210 (+) Transcript_103482:279-908(+)